MAGELQANVRSELRWVAFACFSPRCLLPKVAVLLGISYMFGPWDLIPNRLPIVGHVDEIGFVLGGLVVARFLAVREFGGRLPVRTGGPSGIRSDLWAAWLDLRRRISRAPRRVPAEFTRMRQHLRSAREQRSFASVCFSLCGYRLWWLLHTPFARARSDMDKIVVIGGSPRSGTTLLRSVLGRHPLICSGPETTVFLHRVSSPADIGERMGWPAEEIEMWQCRSRSQMEFIERFAKAAMAREDKPIWAEKTPHNVGRFGFVRRRFPRAKLVHIVRDGRDVICSLRRESFSKLDDAAPESAAAARRCAMQWRWAVTAGLRHRGDPLYHELRYEDLVRDPEPTLRRLMVFLDVPWNDRLLQADASRSRDAHEAKAASRISSTSIQRWEQELSADDIAATSLLLNPLLRSLGYPVEPRTK